MELEAGAWLVTAFAVLITGISKSGLGGALGGLAVPLMAIWISPRDAVAVMLPILVLMDLVGMRAWRGKCSMPDLKQLVPAALVGIAAGTMLFGMMSDQVLKGFVGLIAVAFAADRIIRRQARQAAEYPVSPGWARLAGAVSGLTSTLAHAGGPPVLAYLLGRGLPREVFVASTVYFFAVINAAKLPFYVGLGLFSKDTLLVSLFLAPLVPVGVWMGLRLLRHIPDRVFYAFAVTALGLSGVHLVVSAFW
ncbi:MAG: sulfite exporter TauE/SafE family protein [Zoogloeaceae bacterium]|nr:sulfite exporter TauE/SafE family protein [Zoogloeaceae bacterium]